MFNKVILVGNLTRDIDLRYTSNGIAYARSAIAVTRRFMSNGEKSEETCFIDISFFGRVAEVANQYLSKGSKILVEGRLRFEQWQDSSGQNRSKHSVFVESMEMLGGSNNVQKATQPTNTPKQNNNFNKQEYEIPEVDIDEDINKYDEDDDTIPF